MGGSGGSLLCLCTESVIGVNLLLYCLYTIRDHELKPGITTHL